MEVLYFSVAMVTVGLCAAMGSASLGLGISGQRDKSYLLFGTMCGLMVLFILLPPVGFIVADPAPYSTLVLFKRIPIFLYYAVFPWFIHFYTGQQKKLAPYLITSFTVLSYFVMAAEPLGLNPPLWTYCALVIFATNLGYAIVGTMTMHRGGRRLEARWLGTAMAIFALLQASGWATQIYQVTVGKHLYGEQLYFPIHLHSVALVFIVGLRLAMNKLALERVVDIQRDRWKSFLSNLPLLILEVRRDGTIVTANQFAASRLGLSSPEEIVGLNWFDLFCTEQEKQRTMNLWAQRSHAASLAPTKDRFRVGDHESIVVHWLTFAATSDLNSQNVVLVGQDLTSQESAIVEVDRLRQEIEKEKLAQFHSPITDSPKEIIGSSKALGYTLQKAKQVAATNATVLLEGETGVGKELFADYIHSNSSRKEKPFIKINCSAMPAELIEDELFGHEKGAFTSASSARAGKFELADGGTMLLDEIGELPLALQPKLLRVLQQGEFERVGGQKSIKVDVRIIAATNRDLNREVADGRFRSDLFYRLNVFPISIPALRSRKEDLDRLVNHFIREKSEKYHKTFHQISKADVKRLHEYPWPGNIRELRNLIERSVIQCEGDTLRLQWLDHGVEPDSHSVTSLEEIEREHILKILSECSWKINGTNGAAERLDMNPNTLRSRMKKLNIVREQNIGSGL
jgi:PAS domain S-box-containing protein